MVQEETVVVVVDCPVASPCRKRKNMGNIDEDLEKSDRNIDSQVSVRLRRGVARSTILPRIGELSNLLISRSSLLNWKSIKLESKEENDLGSLIDTVMIGRVTQPDASEIEISEPIPEDNFHLYTPNQDGALSQEISADDSGETSVGSLHWTLPAVEFEGIWENLLYDTELKNEVLSYVYALIRLSERGADLKIINVNRLILLLGPPGTGKTSLCKGLAQQLSIRMNKRFPRSVLVEINSHSLFSKWFSESGKLVLKMFDQIDELAEDKKCLVFVLIDEVESLGMARDASAARGDPADSVRAVNALLTQIDRIRRRDNVLVMSTSNLTDCLDKALLDRADLVRHVGQPSARALYSIMSGCIQEMQRIGVVSSSTALEDVLDHSNVSGPSSRLHSLAEKAKGLSGRAIRQIPALAYSKMPKDQISLEECLNLFEIAISEKLNMGRP